jgi:hypothetical protein
LLEVASQGGGGCCAVVRAAGCGGSTTCAPDLKHGNFSEEETCFFTGPTPATAGQR